MPSCITTLGGGNFLAIMHKQDMRFFVGNEEVRNILVNYTDHNQKIDENLIIVDININ